MSLALTPLISLVARLLNYILAIYLMVIGRLAYSAATSICAFKS